jgi:hypothetical protein
MKCIGFAGKELDLVQEMIACAGSPESAYRVETLKGSTRRRTRSISRWPS